MQPHISLRLLNKHLMQLNETVALPDKYAITLYGFDILWHDTTRQLYMLLNR